MSATLLGFFCRFAVVSRTVIPLNPLNFKTAKPSNLEGRKPNTIGIVKTCLGASQQKRRKP